ncbi:MAG: hypothetical protein N4A33_01725 [Bacteriovoracaceae bacterium]|jgi:hypothetical protein|nr:hypothetical protein [Bacteriovoracaceae bacterium]
MKVLFYLILIMNVTFASEFDDFSEVEEDVPVLIINGDVEIEYGVKENNFDNQTLGNTRFRLKTDKSVGKVSFYGKADFVKDMPQSTHYVDIRELRVNYKIMENTDISIGRQISTWGVADMLFINDLFPKNWVANFQGRENEMLKDPSNALRLTHYYNELVFDFVYQPEFTSDLTPNGCHFSVFDPNQGKTVLDKKECTRVGPSQRDRGLDKPEIAFNLRSTIDENEYGLYVYKGYFKSPRSIELNAGVLSPIHTELAVYGASFEGAMSSGIFSFETGYYESLEDLKGDDFFIENSSLKYLFGYRQDLSHKFSFGVQLYQEKMMHYEEYEKSFKSNNLQGYKFRKKENQSTYTLRLTYKAQQETLLLSLFSYIRPDDKDSFTKVEASKKINNNLKLTAGINIFSGKNNYENREFGMLRDDDNLYTRLNYSF